MAGGEAGKSGGGDSSGGGMVPRTFQSFSANCVMADFTNLNMGKGEALSLISQTYQGVEGVKFVQQGKLVEVSFVSQEAVKVGLEKTLQVGEITVPVTRCFSPKQNVVPIAIHGIPIHPKDDTYKEVAQAFDSFGKIQELKFRFYQLTNIRMDSCSVVLDRTDKEKACTELPQQINLFGKSCDLFWREAKPLCRYCKEEGHLVQKCLKLEKKKAREDKQRMPRLVGAGIVVRGSEESVHTPAPSGKGGDKPEIGEKVQEEATLEQPHSCPEGGRDKITTEVNPGVEVGQVSKEMGAKRRRLIQIETSSDASDDQSASEFLAHTPTCKGESFSTLISQLESLKGDIIETSMSDCDEEMEGAGDDLSEDELILELEEGLKSPDLDISQVGKKVSHNHRAVISLSGVEIDSEDLPSFLQ
jgi:hypothetical protein